MAKNVDNRRKKNNKRKRKHQHLRNFLVLISMLVLALAVFVATVKIISPDFDFSALVPKQITSLASKIIPSEIAPEAPSKKPTVPPTTAEQYLDYLEHEEFSLDSLKKGASVGNILNGGFVDKDGSYIYHFVEGEGIYRFYTYNESFTLFYKTDESLSSLNIREGVLYFVNDDKHTLCSYNKISGKLETLSENILTAYVYDNTAYCISTDNRLVLVDIKTGDKLSLYTASAEEKLCVVGISKNDVFLTAEGDSHTKFIVADKSDKRDIMEFMPMSSSDDIRSLSMEDGFMYYYKRQTDGSYSLIRQKFGSENEVTLAEGATLTNPVIVDKNRVFYSDYKDGRLRLMELNMNSSKTKVMLSVSKVEQDNTLTIQHGGEYDFIIGRKSEGGKRVYSASSSLTSSTNVMKFSKSRWSY